MRCNGNNINKQVRLKIMFILCAFCTYIMVSLLQASLQISYLQFHSVNFCDFFKFLVPNFIYKFLQHKPVFSLKQRVMSMKYRPFEVYDWLSKPAHENRLKRLTKLDSFHRCRILINPRLHRVDPSLRRVVNVIKTLFKVPI